MPTSRPGSPTTPVTTFPQHHPPKSRQQGPLASSYLTSFIRWLQLKKYQYEVTFSLYMLNTTEKIIFNLIILTLLFMLVTAATLYLPNHISIIYNRIWYYVHGEAFPSPLLPYHASKDKLAQATTVLKTTAGAAVTEGLSKVKSGVTSASGRVVATASGILRNGAGEL